MKKQITRTLALLVLAGLALNLSYCGQKGGLTRPERPAFAAPGIAASQLSLNSD